MTFLGDAHKRGKARPGVFSSLADEDQVHSMHMPVPHSLQACCSCTLHSCFALQCCKELAACCSATLHAPSATGLPEAKCGGLPRLCSHSGSLLHEHCAHCYLC